MARPFRKTLKYEALYFFVKAMIAFARLTPRRLWLRICGALARIYFTFAAGERAKAIKSLTVAFGNEKSEQQINALAWKSFSMLGKNAGEILRCTGFSTDKLNSLIAVSGEDYFAQARKSGKGLIFITGHIGAFELMVSYFASRYDKPYVIGTPLKDEKLNNLLLAQRGAHGAMPVERGKDMSKVFRHLKNGGTVAMLIDQDTRVKSTFVDFFGEQAYTPVGAALLAQRTDATVLVGSIHLGEDQKHHIQVNPPCTVDNTGDEEKDLHTNTQRFTKDLEDIIRKYPEQWIWMHQRWKTRPGDVVAD